MNATELLDTRQTTHGSFRDNAEFAQKIRNLYRASPSWLAMPYEHREALDMMATKFSRILSGQSDCRQHWEDVEGYARLALEACTR